MAHVRQQIREAVRDRLKTISDFNNRVFTSRNLPLTQAFPAICIYATEEEAEYREMGNKQSRTLNLVIDVYAQSSANLDDVIDGLCVKIEKKMAEDETLGGLVTESLYSEFGFETDNEREMLTAAGSLKYQVQYRTSEGDPETSV